MTVFTSHDRLRARFRGFAASILLHCGVFISLALIPVGPQSPIRSELHHYSVSLVQLPPLRRPLTAPPVHQPVVRSTALQALTLTRPATAPSPTAASVVRSPAAAEPAPQRATVHRQFIAPAVVRVQPVKQTIVRTDVPPDVRLKEEVPLPTLMLQKLEDAPVFKRQFVVPTVLHVRRTEVAQMIPAKAPEVNHAAEADLLKNSPLVVAEMPHLPLPPPAPAQVRATGTQRVAQASAPSDPELTPPNIAVLSLPENPAALTGLIVVPPANQIATVGGGSGSDAAGGAHGQGQTAVAGSGTSLGGHGTTSDGDSPASNGGVGVAATGTLEATAKGTGTAASSGDASLNAPLLPGTSRISFPKQGKFGVVVMGSTASEPYPESAGALSGRMVYTVYLRVGLRKSWILQYCLPKSAVPVSRVEGTKTPLEAPWPYLVIRPDHTSDSDYVLVRGNISDKGHFDQLALVFPQELEKRDLLLRSLGQWEFRPASRDGVPTGVEVLLIIPRED